MLPKRYFYSHFLILPETMPKQKKLKVRTGARTASKVQEKELVSKAKKIRKNPELVIPKCEHEGKCPLDRVRRQVARARSVADDEKRLSKLAKSGDQLARAYAATLLLTISEKAPYLAVLRTPWGEIAYAIRGSVKKEKLAGVQNYDKPKWRLLALLDLATKKGLHIYSTKKGLVCKGRETAPPDHFVKEMIAALKYALTRDGSLFACEHITKKEVSDKSATGDPYILISWESADKNIAVCQRCATKKSSIITTINQHMAVPKPEHEFEIDVITPLICVKECSDCNVDKHMPIEDDIREAYIIGNISDSKLIRSHLENFQEFLKKGEEKIFILDENCYGTDTDAFVEALNPTPLEKRALQIILEKVEEPVVVSKATPNKVLSLYWDEFGREALNAILGDEKMAEKLFSKGNVSKSSPSHVLKEASVLTKERDIISALPDYPFLPPIAKFADSIARIYMTQGKDDALRAIERYKGGDTRIKSVAYAFLLALNQGASKKWQYTKTEIDFANFLCEPAGKLLKSGPHDYHDNLQGLLSATGSTKKLEKA